ncbi:hypothetical protein F4778DRAFT_733276 [Xylariomycetidae sp. FL2044]|nr:hypothetical protein F4778DRAFT_733276 [Xylariomycetidae sp. FL2044]
MKVTQVVMAIAAAATAVGSLPVDEKPQEGQALEVGKASDEQSLEIKAVEQAEERADQPDWVPWLPSPAPPGCHVTQCMHCAWTICLAFTLFQDVCVYTTCRNECERCPKVIWCSIGPTGCTDE